MGIIKGAEEERDNDEDDDGNNEDGDPEKNGRHNYA